MGVILLQHWSQAFVLLASLAGPGADCSGVSGGAGRKASGRTVAIEQEMERIHVFLCLFFRAGHFLGACRSLRSIRNRHNVLPAPPELAFLGRVGIQQPRCTARRSGNTALMVPIWLITLITLLKTCHEKNKSVRHHNRGDLSRQGDTFLPAPISQILLVPHLSHFSAHDAAS